MKKNAGYTLLNKKNINKTNKNLIQDEQQIQMQDLSGKNYIINDQPQYNHFQQLQQQQYLRSEQVYKTFDDQYQKKTHSYQQSNYQPMKKNNVKLPPLENLSNQSKNYKNQKPTNFNNQENRQSQKSYQPNNNLNTSSMRSNLNQSAYYNPYNNSNTTIVYTNCHPSVVQSIIPTTLSYINRGNNSYYINHNQINQNNHMQNSHMQNNPNNYVQNNQNKPSILVACKYCTLQQNVPVNSKMFTCWACRNNTQIQSQYGHFICFHCNKKIGYQYGLSNLIKCSVCNTVNQVAKYKPDLNNPNLNKNKNNSNLQSQREKLQFKQDNTNKQFQLTLRDDDDIEENDIILEEPNERYI